MRNACAADSDVPVGFCSTELITSIFGRHICTSVSSASRSGPSGVYGIPTSCAPCAAKRPNIWNHAGSPTITASPGRT
jgi:hypothetical protein